MAALPAVFVSHGSPMMAISETPAHRFLTGLGRELARPRAVLAVSAHWETREPRASTVQAPETIHDFGGFPRALYEIRYPAPGAPDLAREALALLAEAGIEGREDAGRGLDHGAWVPLSLMYPGADIPVTQLSVQPQMGARHHARLGEALRPLRERGVLILASGSLTHNLFEFFSGGRRGSDAAVPGWVSGFGDWMQAALEDGRTEDLLEYRTRAPDAARNHPTEEHLLPLYVALGAGSRARPLHRSYEHGVLAMDAYAVD
ncbi:DODA-type extradiol aromatic ring-opening family dioxygenase [Arenibaculum pallidiluteum]|uniref:DODA-type extradiol aromatic ring-opening family dioxygenase n=1 Tax=Arenibaculum pallidiluteum TaxID=2812559 RepID=UPI001A960571|nr:class III extradiol ring-cleavage dioxygenase [Arenibaculum pallidiluteum]